ncbi:MAG TPA: oligoendopeptidase F [Terriglobales bacterium]|nr:oligoendopeptidase F [Terriglobales bacterium]
MSFHRFLFFAILVVATLSSAQQRERDKTPDKYRWDLTAIYPNDDAWRAAKEKFVTHISTLHQFQGKMAASAKALADTLETQSNLQKGFSRLYVYTSLLSDLDTRVSAHQAMKQEMNQTASKFSAEAAFIEPEILKMDPAVINRYVAQEPRLKIYRHMLDDIVRRKDHTLSDVEEKLLAGAGFMASAPSDIFGIFSDADFPYPTVTFSDGKSARLDISNYELYRSAANREDRQKAMAAFFGELGKYRGTFGALMNANDQASNFYARSHKYNSVLESALDGANIPTSVYTKLVDGVNRNLPTFHRYLKLRKRMMGLKDLHYYDLYAPLVASVDLSYTVEQAEPNILAALAPLGPEYAEGARKAFNERWVDMYPYEGKASGAYSSGSAYDVHPFMLMNYNGKYTDMSALAHELGHTMHSYFSNKTQPYALSGYPIFVAEVASTFNEALLLDYVLKTIKDEPTRLSLLGNYLEGIKGTVFRQTQFAEFELRAHEMVEKGQPLTGDSLSKLYGEIVKKYYGNDQGICVVDDYVSHEWAFISHFYSDYYVFQYATSFTASSALSEKVLSGDADATKRYLTFISSGGSKYPIDLLKDAGVDMTTDEPLELTVRKMNRVMDEMERLLDHQGK